MTQNYISLSLETHLFFARIMKEHSLFLTAGFPCKNDNWIKKADYFRQEFEYLLKKVVEISNNHIHDTILASNELVTEFTISAENMTEHLSGVPINSNISRNTQNLTSGSCMEDNQELRTTVRKINEHSLLLLDGLIELKETILKEVNTGKLFTFNYPLLLKHIIREAKLYRFTIDSLHSNRCIPYNGLTGTEEFWNQIMMEHALFIRGLLDPCEETLILAAHNFAMDYKKLLETAKRQDDIAIRGFSNISLEETIKYQKFKTAGTKGILNGDIDSIILPLLADHVLREANHYIRLLQEPEFQNI